MADLSHSTDGPAPSSAEGYDTSLLPDYDIDFVSDADIAAFAAALNAPEHSPSTDDLSSSLLSPTDNTRHNSTDFGNVRKRTSWFLGGSRGTSAAGSRRASSGSVISDARAAAGGERKVERQGSMFITAQNDWAPVLEPGKGKSIEGSAKEWRNPSHDRFSSKVGGKKSRKRERKKRQQRSKDETREGYLYTLLAWPLLGIVGAWIAGLGLSYMLTRWYIWCYEYFVAWRGQRYRLRKKMYACENYGDWVREAQNLDQYLGNDGWKDNDEYAYYDHKTVRRVLDQMGKMRRKVERETGGQREVDAVEELKALVEACVKSNFVGVENSRLYSQTYYGTKNLVQDFLDEVQKSLVTLSATTVLPAEEKRSLFKRMHTQFGRTALCLSGGASFAYYHFGVIKALLDADLLPDVITGTSGGALVAGLVATRTNEELKKLLVPALAGRITACSEPVTTWFPRWWKTGARFDSVDWARRCSWFTRGSMTFKEAYERTGRILNVSCVPADPHSPTILANYLTAPDCVIWSAVLASAAVPGIQNPVVLMMKNRNGTLSPYSFGHKWKDGSLRTDIPLKALNLHFNVNFSIVSQVNPHINLFFFSSRGSVGHPVTHRRGRGWRGGFVGSALEQYLKLDLNKWLKVVRHLELLPRPLGQDWSEIWLQKFSGTITIWPRSVISDFWRILSDPDPKRLSQMLHVGQQSAFPKLKFLGNRMAVERLLEKGRKEAREAMGLARRGSFDSEEEDIVRNLRRSRASSHSVTEGETDGEEALTTGDEDNGEGEGEGEGEIEGYVGGEEEDMEENEEELAREQLLNDLAALNRES